LRNYELMVVVAPQTAEEELTAALDQVSGYIAGIGGEVTEVLKENPFGRRRLAYPIRHNGQDMRDGFYALYHFKANAPRVIEIERNLKLNDRVLRHIVVKQGDENE
jgi:small subunit ribosomal protein S6